MTDYLSAVTASLEGAALKVATATLRDPAVWGDYVSAGEAVAAMAENPTAATIQAAASAMEKAIADAEAKDPAAPSTLAVRAAS